MSELGSVNVRNVPKEDIAKGRRVAKSLGLDFAKHTE